MCLTSVKQFEEIKKAFKIRNIWNYPGEDIELLAIIFQDGFTVPHEAALYKPGMSLGMINCFLDTGSTSMSCDRESH